MKSETSHTPGPWSSNVSGEVFSGETLIALVLDNPDDGMGGIGNEPSDYNAALITAAPDLLAQLKRALACIELAGECLGDMQGMRDAIIKAEGPHHPAR